MVRSHRNRGGRHRTTEETENSDDGRASSYYADFLFGQTNTSDTGGDERRLFIRLATGRWPPLPPPHATTPTPPQQPGQASKQAPPADTASVLSVPQTEGGGGGSTGEKQSALGDADSSFVGGMSSSQTPAAGGGGSDPKRGLKRSGSFMSSPTARKPSAKPQVGATCIVTPEMEKSIETILAVFEGREVPPALERWCEDPYLEGIDATATAPIPGLAEEDEVRICDILSIDGKILIEALAAAGIDENTQRVARTIEVLKSTDQISFPELGKYLTMQFFVHKALTGGLVVSRWARFAEDTRAIFESCRAHRSGLVSTITPQLAAVDPEIFGLALCTIDGQRAGFGDSDARFSVQSACMPVLYACALEEVGEEEVHRWVGREPSGRSVRELCLDHSDRPHNPFLPAGAMVCASLIKRGAPLADRFDHIVNVTSRLAGGSVPGFCNSIFLTERSSSPRNHAIAHMVREKDGFPDSAAMTEALDLWFMGCALEMSVSSLSALAATLANGGVSPLSGEQVLSVSTVRAVLSIMYSCSMYDFSGEAAWLCGVPSKSGASGVILIVVPGVLGAAVVSPRLNSHGNSVRGLDFVKRFVSHFAFHSFDALARLNVTASQGLSRIVEECRKDQVDVVNHEYDQLNEAVNMLSAAAAGDVALVRAFVARGVPVDFQDYDRRSALMVASSEGSRGVVEYLLSVGANPNLTDRFGGTALDDAKRVNRADIVEMIEDSISSYQEWVVPEQALGSELSSNPLDATGPADASCAARNFSENPSLEMQCQSSVLQSVLRAYSTSNMPGFASMPLIIDALEAAGLLISTDVRIQEAIRDVARAASRRFTAGDPNEHTLGEAIVNQETPIMGRRAAALDVPTEEDEFAAGTGPGDAGGGKWGSLLMDPDSSERGTGASMVGGDVGGGGGGGVDNNNNGVNNDDDDDDNDDRVSVATSGSLRGARRHSFASRSDGGAGDDVAEDLDHVPEYVTPDELRVFLSSNPVIPAALQSSLSIGNFSVFQNRVRETYLAALPDRGGEVASYIPQLARVDPKRFGVSVMSTDGQACAFGDTDQMFCLQSCSKVLSYIIALEEHGPDVVHQHVGREPSGRSFNEMTLDARDRPHNPCINAGAIMTVSLIRPHLDIGSRFDYVKDVWSRAAGGTRIGYQHATYLSEVATADRNFALAYLMEDRGAFPQGTDIRKTLELYFQLCSIELNVQQLGVVAATLANYGVCPTTGERVFSAESVKMALSIMYSSGMYDYSGMWSFDIGLPAKSGVSGSLIVVIPGVMGVASWSPRLDAIGNSKRGITFFSKFIETHAAHMFATIPGAAKSLYDPRLINGNHKNERVAEMLFAAASGDKKQIASLLGLGVKINDSDYDGRTATHVAAAEDHTDTLRFLLAEGANPTLKDRWGQTAIDEAEKSESTTAVHLINIALNKRKKTAAART